MKGFVSHINNDEENHSVVIILENKETYVLPLELFSWNVEVDDFVIIENGIVRIDPDSDDIQDRMRKKLETFLNK